MEVVKSGRYQYVMQVAGAGVICRTLISLPKPASASRVFSSISSGDKSRLFRNLQPRLPPPMAAWSRLCFRYCTPGSLLQQLILQQLARRACLADPLATDLMRRTRAPWSPRTPSSSFNGVESVTVHA